jgi:hypothetical protein
VDDKLSTRSTRIVGPSVAEILQADYPGWTIWREINPTTHCHGDWCAEPTDMPGEEHRLRHADIDELRTLLEAADGQQC